MEELWALYKVNAERNGLLVSGGPGGGARGDRSWAAVEGCGVVRCQQPGGVLNNQPLLVLIRGR